MLLFTSRTLLAALFFTASVTNVLAASTASKDVCPASYAELSLGQLKEELVAAQAEEKRAHFQRLRAKKNRITQKERHFARIQDEARADIEEIERQLAKIRSAMKGHTAKPTSSPKATSSSKATSKVATSKVATSIKSSSTAVATASAVQLAVTRAHKTTTKTQTTTSKASRTTTSSSIATPTSTGTSIKRGLGYNDASLTHAFGKNIGWAYNWADSTSGLLDTTEYVPMLWGSDASTWAAHAQAAIDAGATHLLGFNEPDLAAQSNLSPGAAAALWMKNMEPFAGKAKLVAPAITNGGSPGGVTWMQNFLAACEGCHIDAIAAHWYDSATNIGYFQNYFTDMATQFKKPIWITEFAGSGTVAEQTTFFQTVIPWMEKNDAIERYAAFGDFVGTFVDASGALTPLGSAYATTH